MPVQNKRRGIEDEHAWTGIRDYKEGMQSQGYPPLCAGLYTELGSRMQGIQPRKLEAKLRMYVCVRARGSVMRGSVHVGV